MISIHSYEKMQKPVYLGLSISEISKIVMHEFWYEYVKLNHGEKAQLCYMDPDSFTVQIKTEGIFLDIVKDVEKNFVTPSYKLERTISIGKNKKVIGLIKKELRGK